LPRAAITLWRPVRISRAATAAVCGMILRYQNPAGKRKRMHRRLDIELYYLVGSRLANSREWPSWKPGTEFAAERAKRDSRRK
jgi:hypothetical protein